MRKTKFALLSLVMVSLWCAPLFAQSADELIQKHIEALGGYEKMQSIKSLKMTGKMVMQAMGMESEMNRFHMRPNLVRMDINMQGQKMVQAFDGETAWTIFPFMGDPNPQRMPEEQAKMMQEEADFDGALIDYKKKGHSIKVLGKEEVEGTEAFKLEVTQKGGEVFHTFLDSEHFIELKRVSKRTMEGMEIETTVLFSDYKPVAGVMMPHSLKITNPQGAFDITITSVETNVDLDKALFKMPEKSN